MSGIRAIDEKAVESVARMPLSDVVTELIGIIGLKPTAALGGVKHTKHVRDWQRGAAPASALIEQRLRSALQALRLLVMSDGPGIAKAWFFSANPHLDHEIPAYILRDAQTAEPFAQVVKAAHGAAST